MIFKKYFNTKTSKQIYLLILIACVGVFLGRAWQHIFWDPPYRSLLWDEQLFKPIITNIFNTSWEHYVTSLYVDHVFQLSFKIIGILFVLGAIIAVFLNKLGKWSHYYLGICGIWLLFLAILYWKEYFWDFPQFAELTAQWSSPLLLLALYHAHEKNYNILRLLKIVLSLTFLGHGLYAIGLVPLPGQWVDMMINTFSMSESHVKIFLKIVGIGDIIAAILVWNNHTEKPAFGYMMVWGFIAALGRLIGTYHIEIGFFEFLHQQAGEFLFRIPQFLLPAAALLIISIKPKKLKKTVAI